MKIRVVIEPSDEGGYTVHVPSLPGCISEGETVHEALENIHEAIELYLEPVEDDFVASEQALVQEIEL
jgi:predicted RNase H-like HicB family nuclease